jgi:hypothetical protein
MKYLKIMALVLVAAVFLSGCFYTHIISPLDRNVDKTVLGQKTGKADSQALLWLVAWGDAGTAAAARNGGITTVNHIDQEVLSIMFGLYLQTTTIVYGD